MHFCARCSLNKRRPDSITCFVIQLNNSHTRLSCQLCISRASLYKLWPLRASTPARVASLNVQAWQTKSGYVTNMGKHDLYIYLKAGLTTLNVRLGTVTLKQAQHLATGGNYDVTTKKTALVATLMDRDQSRLLLPQPHNLNPDIDHMCGSSGKMNSTWEYMVRKFIAHAWDEPSGAGTEVEGRSPHFPLRQPCFH